MGQFHETKMSIKFPLPCEKCTLNFENMGKSFNKSFENLCHEEFPQKFCTQNWLQDKNLSQQFYYEHNLKKSEKF